MISKLFSLSLVLAGSILPAHAYPNIVYWERIDCNLITETIQKCDRYNGQNGVFIESYYLDIYTNEHSFIDPREPEIVVPDVIEEELYIVEPVLEDETLDDIQPDVEYNQPITTSDPLLNDSY
ncbi:hypothetical protein Syn7803C10_86 [Synechococcus phage ACG-2014f]|uniref:Uncharacterized protein n=2 Tax=Atlauavirus tusconc8 TaxID=2734085 RepID=A0A0E3G1B3_9CAUD|nr:hypothetical protein HOQ62_gp088 [Synechococcus phage ACG-2014f_Syn7803C8]AIX21412.1 hypothetical protein Syn7803C8_88 [Synechococcus phage ACG-2014f_Syn7803C8]AIX29482.1 hypothetical protein Syn7803US30_86 [Synechococcus phage ACG-2014f]AIX40884.1 hypothetical protein Syn7803C10_86 [Synechococcus phage ACG-2014f]